MLDVLTAQLRAQGSWGNQAACKDSDLDFVPSSSWAEKRPDVVLPLIETCAACPVRLQCLTYALETSSTGVWGGTVSEERSALLPDTAADGEWTSTYRRRRAREVAEELEATFPDRLESWRTRPKRRQEGRVCRCGRRFTTSVGADLCRPCRVEERHERIRAYWKANPHLHQSDVARDLHVSSSTVQAAGPPPPFTRKCSRCRKEYHGRRGHYEAGLCKSCRRATRKREPRNNGEPTRRPCAICGKEFGSTSSRRRLCGSPECKREYQRRAAARRYKRRPPRKLTCPVCGSTFEATHSQARYCGAECSGMARRERQKKAPASGGPAPADMEPETGAA